MNPLVPTALHGSSISSRVAQSDLDVEAVSWAHTGVLPGAQCHQGTLVLHLFTKMFWVTWCPRESQLNLAGIQRMSFSSGVTDTCKAEKNPPFKLVKFKISAHCRLLTITTVGAALAELHLQCRTEGPLLETIALL